MIWTIISHFTAQPINCVCQSIVSMFRVLGIFNFACTIMKAVRVDEKKCWVSDGTIFFSITKKWEIVWTIFWPKRLTEATCAFIIANSKTVFTFTNSNFFLISSFAKVEKKVLVLVSKWYLSSGRFTKCFSKQASGLVPCNEAIFLTWPRLGLPS